MIPAARVQTAIEILSSIDDAIAKDGASADVILRQAFAARRYAGSKDRAAISDLVYGVLRRRGALSAAVAATGQAVTARLLVVAKLRQIDAVAADDIVALFTGDRHGPELLTADELSVLAAMPTELSDAVAECPEWLLPSLRRRFGDDLAEELAAFQERAPVTLRVNRLRATPADALAALKTEGIGAATGSYIDDAIVLEGAPRIDSLSLYRDGWVEVQDEGSQIAAKLVDAKPKQQIVDLCAGAGGKTLALAAAMGNKGQIYAYDTDTRRLGNLRDRMKRADARNIQPHDLAVKSGPRAAKLAALLGTMDRVLLDVPCSGSGTWRRSPELPWRMTPEKLATTLEIQNQLLDEAVTLLKPDGRIIYVTCSILPEENEDRIVEFLGRHSGFECIDYRRLWPEAPTTQSKLPECLALSPKSHGTDGFFVAIMQRSCATPNNHT